MLIQAQRARLPLTAAVVVVLATLLAPPAEAKAPRAATTTEQTLVVALQGVEVGKIRARDEVLPDGQLVMRREVELTIARGATHNAIKTETEARFDADLHPQSFRYARTDASGTMTIARSVENGMLVGGGAAPIKLPKTATFALGLEYDVKHRLKDGLHETRTVVLEEMAAVAEMVVDVKKRGSGFVITSSFQGLVTEEEVDAKGNTIVSRTPGVGLVAYPPGRAPADLQKGNADLLAVSTWKVKPVRPPVSVVRYRLNVADGQKFVVPEDDRQKVMQRTAKAVEIEVKAGVSQKATLSAERKAALLQSTPYEAVQDPKIVAAAQKAAAGAKDKRDEVSRLNRFVYDHVESKGLDRGYVEATVTLAAKAGDCTEHSVLLSALLRSRGFPTRLVDGIVVDGERAGYHEWVEVYLEGEGFVAADPTFGVFPAGPERLKLAEGSTAPDEHLQLSLAAARLLGQAVRFEVLEAR